jgi:hypothetical protein
LRTPGHTEGRVDQHRPDRADEDHEDREVSESLMMNSASGIQASGEIGLSTWMNGFSAL